MPNRCVVWGCDSTPNPKEGIFLYTISFFGVDRPEERRRRKFWVSFVSRKRKNFTPSKGSCICSKHFKPEDFTIRFTLLPGHDRPIIPRLRRDSVGICVFPSVQTTDRNEEEMPMSNRKRRKIIKTAIEEQEQRCHDQHELSDLDKHLSRSGEETSKENVGPSHELPSTDNGENLPLEEEIEYGDPEGPSKCSEEEFAVANKEVLSDRSAVQGQEGKRKRKPVCYSCTKLRRERNWSRQRCTHLKKKLEQTRVDLRDGKERELQLEREIEVLHAKCSNREKESETQSCAEETKADMEDDQDSDVSDIMEEEPDFSSDESSLYATETESEDTETEDETSDPSERLTLKGKNLRTEPKHIVFLSQLLLLFKFCHYCKSDDPLVEAREMGTEVIVSTTCKNPRCPKKDCTWRSQPTNSSGIRGPAGNFLLSMTILFAGGSASKVFQIFSHMGLGCISLNTFFKHQRRHLFPIIYVHWKKYQTRILDGLKSVKDGLVLAGDGRHDSMGNSAKYGAYTIFCCNIPQIIHFSLIQRNQAESSPAMEFMVFKKSMTYLLGYGLQITTFISDRHTSIASYMKKVLVQIRHYFDLWHLKKKIRKVLSKLAQEKSCECLKDWIKPCENHLYWSATTTFSGNGDVIWAKFKSFFSHVINKHKNLGDPLFNRCGHVGHGEIQERKWLDKGSTAHDKLVTALTKNSLVKGIKQASPIAQTSCLEGFHSVLNHFCPKMIAYSYVGMYCRYILLLHRQILAILHFNLNLERDTKVKPDGTEQLRVSYPKFKNGEATIKNCRVAQDFSYVEDIYDTFLKTSKAEIFEAIAELKQMTPTPMCSAFEKQSTEEAIKKRQKRRSTTVKDVPLTTPVHEVQAQMAAEKQQRKLEKLPPKCTLCKQPMKGHNKVKDCPRNKKT